MRLHFLPALIIGFAATSVLVCAAESETAKSKWFELTENQAYVADFALKPGETKPVEIPATGTQAVGFKSDLFSRQDITKEQRSAHIKKNIIRMAGSDGKGWIETSLGGTYSYGSKDGKISITLENKSDLEVKVVVYTSLSKSDKAP
ncbi:MAG TPA: hypothetical protein VF614_07335 [Chthoniobacteraceae bacterium]|jgi:hypothetical protein